MGSGQMLADGASLAVTVAGSAAGDRSTIFVSSTDKPQVFRLELSASRTALAGECDFLTIGSIRESGTVTGSITLSSQPVPPTVLGKSQSPGPLALCLDGPQKNSLKRKVNARSI